LDGDYTDAIYASEDGTVVEAGWNSGGYGLQVVIDHGNGFKTRYGIVANPFAQGLTQGLGALVADSNVYYRKTAVAHIL
jgi:hypothetical protein